MPNKSYLGDSVYAEENDCYITLTTDNGMGPSNTIHLEPHVFYKLLSYAKRLGWITEWKGNV